MNIVDTTIPIVSVIEDKFKNKNPLLLEAIKHIGDNILSTGMTAEDSAIMYRLNPEVLPKIYKEVPEVEMYFKIQRIKNKSQLLKSLHDAAKTDSRIASALLERQYADEYDQSVIRQRAKQNMNPNEADNVVTQIISFVRQVQTGSPVNPAAGLPVNVMPESEEIERRLDAALLVKNQ